MAYFKQSSDSRLCHSSCGTRIPFVQGSLRVTCARSNGEDNGVPTEEVKARASVRIRMRAQGFDNFIRKIKLHGANLVSAARRASHRMWRVTPRGDDDFQTQTHDTVYGRMSIQVSLMDFRSAFMRVVSIRLFGISLTLLGATSLTLAEPAIKPFPKCGIYRVPAFLDCPKLHCEKDGALVIFPRTIASERISLSNQIFACGIFGSHSLSAEISVTSNTRPFKAELNLVNSHLSSSPPGYSGSVLLKEVPCK